MSPLTGDYSYGFPIVSVAGPNGENFTLKAAYSAGIAVDQQSSELGLGWALNAPSIRRQVNGYPDDFAGVYGSSTTYYKDVFGNLLTKTEQPYVFGPVNYDRVQSANMPFSATKDQISMDMERSARGGFSRNPVERPAFDEYQFQGMMGGAFRPTFSYSGIFGGVNTNGNTYSMDGARLLTENTTIDGVGYYSFWETSNSSNDLPFDSEIEFEDLAFIMGSDVEQNTAIKAYRNNDLKTSYPQGFIEADNLSNADRADNTQFPEYGLGAFAVTNTDGFTYHYSLPVYRNKYRTVSTTLTDPGQADPAYYSLIGMPDEGDSMYVNEVLQRFAIEWKLVAVTGPDYVDVNMNNKVDPDDQGYWIKFTFAKWSDDFNWRAPYNGYSNITVPTPHDGDEDDRPLSMREYAPAYLRRGTMMDGEEEIYYLSTIETSTMVAALAYDLRNDAVSTKDGSGKVQTKLALKAVFLFNAEDEFSESLDVWFSTDLNFSSASYSSLINLPSSTLQSGLLNYKYYQVPANKALIDADALESVIFNQDYSLAKNIPDHLSRISASSTDIKWTNNAGADYKISEWTSAAYSNQGKLTLLGVRYYGLNGIRAMAKNSSIEMTSDDLAFTYGYNPDYSMHKVDYWGYFNSARTAWTDIYNLNSVSKDNVDAWSLTSIAKGEGMRTDITYESDEYSFIIDGYTYRPTILALFKNASHISNTASTAEFYSSDGYDLLVNPETHKAKVLIKLEYDEFCDNDIDVRQAYYELVETWSGSGSPDQINISNISGLNYQISGLKSTGYEECLTNSGTSSGGSGQLVSGYVLAYYDMVYGGGVRVASITEVEIPTGLSYVTEYEYSEGSASSEPKDYVAEVGISNAMYSTDFTGISPTVAYSSVKTYDRGADNRNYGYTQIDFDIPSALSTTVDYTSSQQPCMLFIPQILMHMPVNQLKDTVLYGNANGRLYRAIPRVLKGHFKSLPNIFGDVNTYYTVGGTLADHLGYGNPNGSTVNKIYCQLTYMSLSDLGPGALCSSTYTSVQNDQLWPYYTEDWFKESAIIETSTYIDKSRFGRVLKESIYSANGTLLQSKVHEYERSGVYTERYFRHLLRDPNAYPLNNEVVNYQFVSNLHYYRYAPTQITTYSEGGMVKRYSDDFESSTNFPESDILIDESSGALVTQLTYAHTIESSLGKVAPGAMSSQVFSTNQNRLMLQYESSVTSFLVENRGFSLDIDAQDPGQLLATERLTYTNSAAVRTMSSGTFGTSQTTLPTYVLAYTSMLLHPQSSTPTLVPSISRTLFDERHNAIELKDEKTDIYSASLINPITGSTITSVTGCNYYSFSAAIFENLRSNGSGNFFAEGEFFVPNAIGELTGSGGGISPHTGEFCLQVQNATQVFVNDPHLHRETDEDANGNGIETNRTYKASVWVHENSNLTDAKLAVSVTGTVSGSPYNQNYQMAGNASSINIDGWIKLEVTFTVPENFVGIGNDGVRVSLLSGSEEPAYFDDFRLRPIDVPMQVTVRDRKTNRMTEILDEENMFSRSVYDHAGRVIIIYHETLNGVKLISELEYDAIGY